MDDVSVWKKGIFTFDEPYTRHRDGYHMKRTSECNSLQGQIFALMEYHAGNRLCFATQEAVATMDREGSVYATLVNASFQNHTRR